MIPGAHVSTAGGASNAPLNAKKLGFTAFQIFSRNQNQWKAKPLDDGEVDRYLKNCEECGIEWTVIHDSYLINLCAVEDAKLEMSREAFLDEMVRAEALRVPYLVMHPGSHRKAGEEAGLKKIAESLRMLIDRQSNGSVRILLEGTAGQGTNLGYRFEHLAEIMRLVDAPERMGICLDTCHLYAAGYDFTTEDDYAKMMQDFDEIVGMDNLYCIHLNDSKKELGSKVDRHENIGKGVIGVEPFAFFVNDVRLKEIPGILETPGGDEAYLKDLVTLRDLIQ